MPGIGKLLGWFLPFLRTPINLGISMIERSPAGVLRGKWTEEAAAKILTGSIVTAVGGLMAYQGNTTWSPPTDPKEKELFFATGRKPFCVKIGDNWIPLWYMGPFALSFGIPAAVKHYTQDRKQALTDDGIDKLLGISQSLAQFIGSQTATPAIGALFSALSGDVNYTFPAQTAFTLQQAIPVSALIRYINTIIDPVYRHPKTFIEKIEANLPYFSKQIPAYETPLMEEAKREPINYFLPYDVGKAEPLYEALYDIERFKSRNKHLADKFERVIRRRKAGEITIEESFEEWMKIIQAGPKSMEQFSEEMQQ